MTIAEMTTMGSKQKVFTLPTTCRLKGFGLRLMGSMLIISTSEGEGGEDAPAPLQTELSRFCEMKYLLEKETHNKNEDNTLKELNEIFLTIYGLAK